MNSSIVETEAGEQLCEKMGSGVTSGKPLTPDAQVDPVWKAGKLTDADDPKPLYESIWVKEIFNGKNKTAYPERPDVEFANEDEPEIYETEFGHIKQYYTIVGGSVHAYYRQFCFEPTLIEETVENGWRTESLYGVLKELNMNIAKVLTLQSLEDQLSQINSLDELLQQSNRKILQTHDRRYGLLNDIWISHHGGDPENSHVWGTRLSEKSKTFEITQFPQGFFQIPKFWSGYITRLVGEALEARELGKYSVAWGGFIVEPENFTEVAELIGPLYVETPGVDL